jgi:hypothetical protein
MLTELPIFLLLKFTLQNSSQSAINSNSGDTLTSTSSRFSIWALALLQGYAIGSVTNRALTGKR